MKQKKINSLREEKWVNEKIRQRRWRRSRRSRYKKKDGGMGDEEM